MRFIPRALLYGAAVLGVWLLPVAAQAEPIVITSGFLTSTGLSNVGRFQFSGVGFSAVGDTDMGFVSPAECFFCESGDVLSLSATLGGRLNLREPIIIDGSPFTNSADADILFTAPSIVIPPDPRDFSVRLPFTFSGQLLMLDETGQHTLFSRDLAGQGQLTANFVFRPQVDDIGAFEFVDIRYDFAAADPIPEPMTLLLVGSGLGGIALRTRRSARPN